MRDREHLGALVNTASHSGTSGFSRRTVLLYVTETDVVWYRPHKGEADD